MKILNESIDIKNNINNTNIILNNNNKNNNNILKLNEENEDEFNENDEKNLAKSVLIPCSVSFPVNCNICQKFPVTKVLYYCHKCSLYLCQDCEQKVGYNHRHCYYKINKKYKL